MIIAVDFDMTISDASGKMIESAKETINQLKDDGHSIILWTSRTGERLNGAIEYLKNNEVKFDHVNQNIPGIKDDPRKVIADYYIDDKNIGGFPGWNKAYKMITTKKHFREMENKEYITGTIRDFDRAKAEESRTVEFVISDNTRDRHGTVIPVKNWKLDNYNSNGIVGYQHGVYGSRNEANPDQILGIGKAYVEDGKLIGRVQFEPADINPLAEKIFQKVLHGTLKATSVGFRELEKGTWGEKEKDEDITGKNPTYYFGPVELLEFSIVNIPSNPNALRREMDEKITNKTRELTDEIERLRADNFFLRKVLKYYQNKKA